jgi:hypothetical protein
MATNNQKDCMGGLNKPDDDFLMLCGDGVIARMISFVDWICGGGNGRGSEFAPKPMPIHHVRSVERSRFGSKSHLS